MSVCQRQDNVFEVIKLTDSFFFLNNCVLLQSELSRSQRQAQNIESDGDNVQENYVWVSVSHLEIVLSKVSDVQRSLLPGNKCFHL